MLYYLRGHEIHDPTICMALTINAGSFHETEKESGIAHFLEHINMSFDKYGYYKKELKSHVSAYTDYFETTYIIQAFPESYDICNTIFEKII